jgi:hypothetical protein
LRDKATCEGSSPSVPTHTFAGWGNPWGFPIRLWRIEISSRQEPGRTSPPLPTHTFAGWGNPWGVSDPSVADRDLVPPRRRTDESPAADTSPFVLKKG